MPPVGRIDILAFRALSQLSVLLVEILGGLSPAERAFYLTLRTSSEEETLLALNLDFVSPILAYLVATIFTDCHQKVGPREAEIRLKMKNSIIV